MKDRRQSASDKSTFSQLGLISKSLVRIGDNHAAAVVHPADFIHLPHSSINDGVAVYPHTKLGNVLRCCK